MNVFGESWSQAKGGTLPRFMYTRASIWAGIKKPDLGARPAQAQGDPPAGPAEGEIAVPPQQIDLTDAPKNDKLTSIMVSEHDIQQAMADVTVQKISGMRVLSLSLALMSGTVHPMGDSAEIRYSSDICLSPLIRQQRKVTDTDLILRFRKST